MQVSGGGTKGSCESQRGVKRVLEGEVGVVGWIVGTLEVLKGM